MKILTKNTDYATRALLVLASCPEKYFSARDIAKNQGMPYSFTRKILTELHKNGYVVSREGGGGGFKLKGDASKIRITDLIKVFQGEIKLSECMFRKKICRNRPDCVLRRNIERIEKLVENEFGNISIGSLLKDLRKK